MEHTLITGATRGLGRALAETLAQRGHRVFATGRDLDVLQELARTLNGSAGSVEPIEMDVASNDSVTQAAKKIMGLVDRLDCLVNNAGVILEGGHGFADLPPDTLADTININATGAFRTMQAFAELLAKSSNARIVNVSSGMGVMEGMGSGTTAYRTSKAAMNVLSLQAHYALSPRGIRVMSVCPGWVRTDMGGASASRAIGEGVQSILWAVDTQADGPSGKFFRDGREISW